MSFVTKYCPTSTVVRNPASVQNLLGLSCCDNFSIRSLFLFQSYVCLDHTWHERCTRLSSHNESPRSVMAGFIFFTHVCDCSVKTELIYRNYCAKNSFNRRKVGAIVYRQFPMAFAFEPTSGQWTCCTENWMSAFCEFQHHPFRHIVPVSLWTIFTDRRPHCPAENLFAFGGKEIGISLAFFFIVS